MFGLKGAYYYLAAIQISLIKFVKKIYFSTSFYNNSLKTKIPTQIYFSPNPFLLSIISPFKKKSFKISEINPNEFWIERKNKNLKDYHNFLWLNLIDRKADGKNIQKIIYLWSLKYSNFKRGVWETSTLSSRIISWILNVDIIINNGTFDFKKKFFLNIISQCNHLKKNIRFENDHIKKIEILVALILSGLVFKEYEENFKIGIKELERFVKYNFDADGFPLSRNPNDLVLLSKYLILCFESIKDAQQYIPEFLEDIVEKNLTCLNLIKTPDNSIPFFNGASEIHLDNFEEYLNKTKKSKKNIIGGIFFAKVKNQTFYLDVGCPPSKNFSRDYQSGPLSFEYYLDGIKIITNCGFGNKISAKAELISKFTASHSTLTINDTTINKFESNKLLNNIYGSSIKNTFKTSEVKIKNDINHIGCSTFHDGYEKKFRCIHKREIYIDKQKNHLQGIDHIVKKSDGLPIRYNFRFHLNPSLTAVKTMSGNSVLLQISKNKSLIFTVKEEILEIEKSIFLGGKKILDSTCITFTGNLVNKNKSFYWEIAKKI